MSHSSLGLPERSAQLLLRGGGWRLTLVSRWPSGAESLLLSAEQHTDEPWARKRRVVPLIELQKVDRERSRLLLFVHCRCVHPRLRRSHSRGSGSPAQTTRKMTAYRLRRRRFRRAWHRWRSGASTYRPPGPHVRGNGCGRDRSSVCARQRVARTPWGGQIS